MSAPAYGRRAEPVTVEDILGRLEAVRASGEGRWMARCPAHGDRTASLSIRVGDDSRILLHDFSGCSFLEIVEALGLRPEQLFSGASDRPWTPRPPRPDPERETRELFERLRTLHRPPDPERMRRELILVGLLLLGGMKAFREELPADFASRRIQTFALRIAFEAMAELVKQGTPRRWFSALALADEVDRHGGRGYARRLDLFTWCRLAVGTAIAEKRRDP